MRKDMRVWSRNFQVQNKHTYIIFMTCTKHRNTDLEYERMLIIITHTTGSHDTHIMFNVFLLCLLFYFLVYLSLSSLSLSRLSVSLPLRPQRLCVFNFTMLPVLCHWLELAHIEVFNFRMLRISGVIATFILQLGNV